MNRPIIKSKAVQMEIIVKYDDGTTAIKILQEKGWDFHIFDAQNEEIWYEDSDGWECDEAGNWKFNDGI